MFLSGFQAHNSDGINNYLDGSCSIAAGTNEIDYTFTTDENNTITSICYFTIVFNEIVTQEYYYNIGQMGEQMLSNTVGEDPTQFAPLDIY